MRFHRYLAPAAVLALLFVAAGCNGGSSTIGPAPGSDASLEAAVADIALESDGLTDAVLDAELGSVLPSISGATSGSVSGVVTTDVSFTRTRPCPAGGEVVVEGNLHVSRDRATGVMEASFTGTRTFTDCAFVRGEFTITVNGSTTMEWMRRRVNGVPDGPQITRYSGQIHAVRSDGAEKFCDFEVEIVRDPGAGTRTMTGSLCGSRFHRVAVWGPGG